MDAWSIHPYRYPQSRGRIGPRRRSPRHCRPRRPGGGREKAWVTEIGWPTHRTSTGSDEHAQACHAVRAVAILQSTGVVEKVFWYDFKDDGLNREDNESNFGVVRNQSYNCAPKPAVVALALFLRLTHGAPCGPLWHEGKAYAVAYRLPDGRQRLVAWAWRRHAGPGVGHARRRPRPDGQPARPWRAAPARPGADLLDRHGPPPRPLIRAIVFALGWHAVTLRSNGSACSFPRKKPVRMLHRSASGTSRFPAYQAGPDHRQSCGLATSPRDKQRWQTSKGGRNRCLRTRS